MIELILLKLFEMDEIEKQKEELRQLHLFSVFFEVFSSSELCLALDQFLGSHSHSSVGFFKVRVLFSLILFGVSLVFLFLFFGLRKTSTTMSTRASKRWFTTQGKF